jgi:hypothetical protein
MAIREMKERRHFTHRFDKPTENIYYVRPEAFKSLD